MKKIVCLLVSILLVAALTAAGFAQSDFPKKEITIIVPFSAGGATDLMARSLQPIFKELLDVNTLLSFMRFSACALTCHFRNRFWI